MKKKGNVQMEGDGVWCMNNVDLKKIKWQHCARCIYYSSKITKIICHDLIPNLWIK